MDIVPEWARPTAVVLCSVSERLVLSPREVVASSAHTWYLLGITQLVGLALVTVVVSVVSSRATTPPTQST